MFMSSTDVCLAKKRTQYLGKFKITYYCGCARCCGGNSRTATGTKAKAGRTIAVDPRVIKLGSKVKIGNKIYVAEDTGGAIKGKVIDMFVSSHEKACRLGVKYKKVYLVKNKKLIYKLRRINEKDNTNSIIQFFIQ